MSKKAFFKKQMKIASELALIIFGLFLIIDDVLLHWITTLFPVMVFGNHFHHLYVGIIFIIIGVIGIAIEEKMLWKNW